MKEKLMGAYLKGKIACLNAMEKFLNEEKGASDIVAILVVIIIIIAVAAIFKDKLLEFVNKVMGNLLSF